MIPPTLVQHINELRNQGHTIEVVEYQNELGVIFKNYSISSLIWARDKTDLLVLTTPTYPNSKMDMFWVSPKLTLKDGRMPKNGDNNENHCGGEWQRFSWHPTYWNPAVDNLLTYLDFVERRLRTNE